MKIKKIILSVFSLFVLIPFYANIRLPYIFTDNMVLQRNAEISIWGEASPKEPIKIVFKNQTKTTVADQNGNWEIKLDKEKEGGPFKMIISGENTIQLNNILIGDVWLCSGQSNMEWTLGATEGYDNEVRQQKFPLIRQIKIEKQINSLPQNNILKTQWQSANAKTIGDFSGVAYFFAKKMFDETGVPIGIINSSWGGTVIETWIPRSDFQNSEYFNAMISKIPNVDIEQLQKENIERKTLAIEKKLNSKIVDFDSQNYLLNTLDNTVITQINAPQPWEEQGFEGLDGVVWMKKIIELTEDDIKKDATIYLSKIDDEDISYFNGVIIGQNKQWSQQRVYNIPKKNLKKGKNVIVVKITDTGGGGGFWGEEKDMKLVTSYRSIPLSGKWEMKIEKIYSNINQNEFPSLIYNAMIHPIKNLSISGILWYQGESNVERAHEYNYSLPLLINSWQNLFGKDKPFYFVQISSFQDQNDKTKVKWAELRDAQTQTLSLQNTGMVVTTDIGTSQDIHPRNKKDVGYRLANLALKNGIISPVYENMTMEGNKIQIYFSPSTKLKSKNNEPLIGFEIAGENKIFYPAKAYISGNKIIVSNENILSPVAVRYGWKNDDSDINLFSENGLPVSPFRTDDFETVTHEVKFKTY